jgi:hypothetical protein
MPHTQFKLALLSLAIPLVAIAAEPYANTDQSDLTQHSSSHKAPAPLIEKVRRATWRYRDINVALSGGFVQGTPCVSGPNAGAMGVHFLLPSRVGDGVLNANEPESLIYEPQANGTFHLVGVEFIVLKADWESLHPGASPPSIDGNLTNLVTEPNRYGLPAFYEMHVWAWEQNPSGNYADYNNRVTCEKQPIPVT